MEALLCLFYILYYFRLFHSLLFKDFRSIDRYDQGKHFSDIFQTIWRTGAKFEALFKLATCSNYSITNYVKFPMFYFFEKENK